MENQEKENFCVVCQTTHHSPKWYKSTVVGMLICKKEYLKQYYIKNKESLNNKFKTKYKENDEFRKHLNEKNKENDKKRRLLGYKRIRKPRSEWTIEEKQKEREAKQKYKESHPEKIIEKNKEFHRKHYEENIEQYELLRKTAKYQFRTLRQNAEKRGMSVTLSYEQFEAKRQKTCHYCQRKLEDTGTCIDVLDCKSRLYNDQGTVPCCHVCNFLKGPYLTEEETLFAILALKQYHCDKKIPDKILLAISKKTNTNNSISSFSDFEAETKSDGKSVELTEQEYLDLLKYPCFYCGGVSTGLDRLDNTIRSYVFDNCVPCCPTCNRIKSNIFNYEEAFVVINAVQKLRIFYHNLDLPKKICSVCGTDVSTKWIKHPDTNGFLCSIHYEEEFYKKNKMYGSLIDFVDFDNIFNAYSNLIHIRSKSRKIKAPKGIKKIRRLMACFIKYKNIIESRNMLLFTTFEEYQVKSKHRLLTIQCQKGHVFKRDSNRIKLIDTCPDCEGVSNRGGAFKEKLAENGWAYVSGEYINKESILTVTCEHGRAETKKYRWLRDNTCKCFI